MRKLLPFMALSLFAGCGGSEEPTPSDDAGDVRDTSTIQDTGPLPPPSLTVRSVMWNAANAMTGTVTALAEDGDRVVLSSDRGTLVFTGGALVSTDMEVRSARSAATVAAGDGTGGRWVLLVDAMGKIWRLRDRGTVEDVTARYGLGMRAIRTVARPSDTAAAFGGMQSFAIANGMSVMVWNDPRFADLVAGGGRLATVADDGVRVFDPMGQRFLTYALQGVSSAALGANGRLIVTAGRSLYVENMDGALVEVAVATAVMRGAVVSGTRTWLVVGNNLARWDGNDLRIAPDVMVPEGAKLIGSASGDVWALNAGQVARYALLDSPDQHLWEEIVRPVYARRCVPCHLPGGTGNLDLSTYQAWVMRRGDVRTQVIDQRTMPPNPPPLADDDRSAIARWLNADAGMEDSGVDASMPRDTAVDVTGDVAMDAGVRPDAAMDVPRVDVAMDVPRDTGVRPDVGMDVPRDTGPVDTGPRDTGPVDTGPRDTGVRDTGTVDAGSAFAPTYAILAAACVRCHGTSGGLDLSTESLAYTNLVGVAARGGTCAGGSRVRVVRGNATMSLLYQKLTNTQDCGNSMPRGAAALNATQLTTIRTWINAGANR